MLPNTQRKPASRLAWGLLLALTGAWLSVGCSPATVYMLLVPFTDTNLPPKHKLAVSDKEINVVVVSRYARLEIRPELLDAHNELAEKFVAQMAKRTKENKEKLKFVPLSQVRAHQNKQGLNAIYSPAEIGKHFKADFVVSFEIANISLFEKRSIQFYRGTSEISVALFDLSKDEGEQRVFAEDYGREFPRHPIDAGGSSPTQFRALYLTRVANDMSKLFTSYPPEERYDE